MRTKELSSAWNPRVISCGCFLWAQFFVLDRDALYPSNGWPKHLQQLAVLNSPCPHVGHLCCWRHLLGHLVEDFAAS